MAATLVLFAVTAHHEWSAVVTIAFIGLFGFAVVPAIQTLVMQKAYRAPTLASATVQAAFNLANAQGAYLGGVALSAGLGWTSPTLVGAALATLGFLIASVSWWIERRTATRTERATTYNDTEHARDSGPISDPSRPTAGI
jgi:DHA1 family inner membrane transport protein